MTCKGTADVEINSPFLRSLNWQMQPEVGQATSVDLPTCIAQLNSMWTAVCMLHFVKMIEKGMREGDCGNTDAGKEGEDRSSIAECP